MMRIEKLSNRPDRAGRYTVQFEDGTLLRLYRQTVEDFSLYTGKELDGEEYARLKTAAGQMSAKMRAVRIVSASSVSKQDLQQRLVMKGEDPGQAREAVAWMTELNLLDDKKTAEQIVHTCISKGYGVARAKQALYEKRIPKEYWEEALAEYPDQSDAVADYLLAHITDPNDPKQIRKAIDALLRRGHHYTTIRRELGRLSVNEEFLEEP